MVSYRIRRLAVEGETARRYHLFDRNDQLLLVADQGSAWLPSGDPPQVRFARPDGERVASMDLPRLGPHPDKKTNYAVIYEHAVYALLTAVEEKRTGDTGPLPPPGVRPFNQLIIEVEGNKWLGLRWSGDEGPLMILYDAGAAGLSTNIDPDSADLPEPIGLLEVGAGDYDFDLTLPGGRLAQAPLLGLALVYLVDSGK
jgi:hypothetical protein